MSHITQCRYSTENYHGASQAQTQLASLCWTSATELRCSHTRFGRVKFIYTLWLKKKEPLPEIAGRFVGMPSFCYCWWASRKCFVFTEKKYSTSFDRIIVVLLVFFSINAPSHFTVANILWVLYFGKEYQKSFAQQKIWAESKMEKLKKRNFSTVSSLKQFRQEEDKKRNYQ